MMSEEAKFEALQNALAQVPPGATDVERTRILEGLMAEAQQRETEFVELTMENSLRRSAGTIPPPPLGEPPLKIRRKALAALVDENLASPLQDGDLGLFLQHADLDPGHNHHGHPLCGFEMLRLLARRVAKEDSLAVVEAALQEAVIDRLDELIRRKAEVREEKAREAERRMPGLPEMLQAKWDRLLGLRERNEKALCSLAASLCSLQKHRLKMERLAQAEDQDDDAALSA